MLTKLNYYLTNHTLVYVKCVFCKNYGFKVVCNHCLVRLETAKPSSFTTSNANYIDGIYCQFRYTNTLMHAIRNFKYNHRKELAWPLGYLLNLTLQSLVENGDTDQSDQHSEKKTIIIPMPLHPKRLKERGYNQAVLLLKYFIAFGKPAIKHAQGITLSIDQQLVVRKLNTQQQTNLNYTQRVLNLKNAFTLTTNASGKYSPLMNARVIVVDDVLTTGSTCNELARVLKLGGAKTVQVCTVALATHS